MCVTLGEGGREGGREGGSEREEVEFATHIDRNHICKKDIPHFDDIYIHVPKTFCSGMTRWSHSIHQIIGYH